MTPASCILTALLAMVCFAAAVNGDWFFSNPTWKNIKVDWCRDWEANCGKAAADTWCAKKGFPLGAASYVGPRHVNMTTSGCQDMTILPKYDSVCNPAVHVCDTFYSITCKGPITYYNPTVRGLPLDVCKTFATDCGWPAAHWWCQSQGYNNLISQTGYRLTSGQSIVGSTGAICDTRYTTCDAFATITCGP